MFDVYRTDELENAIDFLEQASIFYNNKENPHRFKWVCICLHGALYGFAVSNVRGTDPVNRVLVESKKKKEFHERDLKGIWSVLELCKDKEMLPTEFGRVLELDENKTAAIVKVINYRNSFSHFKPSGYSIMGSLDEIVGPILEVIYFFAFESNNILYSSRGQKERIQQAFDTFELNSLTE